MWEDQFYVEGFIQAAVDAKLPPTMVILNDPTHTEYTTLDLKLIKALHLKKLAMSNNFPAWIDRSDRVTFTVKSFRSGSQAALERKQYAIDKAAQQNNATPAFGMNYYAVPETIDGGPMPTLEEWLEEEKERRNEKRSR